MKNCFMLKILVLTLTLMVIGSLKLYYAILSESQKKEIYGKHQEVVLFLELLKANRTVSRQFDVDNVPKWDVKGIAGFIYSGGVTVEDVNTNGVKKYSPNEVEQALILKNGEIFSALSHISYLYAVGKKQYSALNFIDKPDGVLAVLASWYELEFVYEGNQLKLRKCKYINEEED